MFCEFFIWGGGLAGRGLVLGIWFVFFKFGAGFDGLFLVWGTTRERVVFVLFQGGFFVITPI